MAGCVRMNRGNNDFRISIFEASERSKNIMCKLFL